MRSSTRRLDARGATPGRVTVHCWSRVALLRDWCACVSLGFIDSFGDGCYLRLRVQPRRCKSSTLALPRSPALLSGRAA